MKVKITRVHATDKKKDGTQLISKDNKPYHRVGIKTEQHGDEWLNGFCYNAEHSAWSEGTELEITVEEKEWNSKKQLNFRLQSRIVSREEFDALVKRVDDALDALEAGTASVENGAGKEDVVNGDDLPF